MKYLFDMGEVWHLYSDVGNQWVYQRMEQVDEETLDKDGDNLPGPLGRLDVLKALETECERLKKNLTELEHKNEKVSLDFTNFKREREQISEQQKKSFQKSYTELQDMAEELQKEGKLWRQRYLDLSYQVAKNKERL